MNNEINNRLEAFLTWKSTGEKPEGWDLEPRNQQEYWISEEAKRIDRIEFGNEEVTRGSAAKSGSKGTNDYNELDNIPINPMPQDEKIEEGEYYYRSSGKQYYQIGDIPEDTYFDRITLSNNLVNLTYYSDSETETWFPNWEICNLMSGQPTDLQEEMNQPMFWAVHDKVNDKYAVLFMMLIPCYIEDGFNGETYPESSSLHRDEYNWILLNDGTEFRYDNDLFEAKNQSDSKWHSLAGMIEIKNIEPNIFYNYVTASIGQVVNDEFKELLLDNTSLYQHNIKLTVDDSSYVYFSIINKNSQQMTFSDISSYLNEVGYTQFYSSKGFYPISGYCQSNAANYYGMAYVQNNELYLLGYSFSQNTEHVKSAYNNRTTVNYDIIEKIV